MKECPNCKKQLPDLAKFCTNCGSKIELSESDQQLVNEKMTLLKAKLDSLSSNPSRSGQDALASGGSRSWDDFVVKRAPAEVPVTDTREDTGNTTEPEVLPEPEARADAGDVKIFSLEDRMKHMGERKSESHPEPEDEPSVNKVQATARSSAHSNKVRSQKELEELVQKKKKMMEERMKGYNMDGFIDNMLSSPTTEENAPASDREAETEVNGGGSEKDAPPRATTEPSASIEDKDPEPSSSIEIITLRSGRGYLIEEEKPRFVFKLLSQQMTLGHNGLCISRQNPRRLAEDYDLTAGQLLWLTDSTTSNVDVIPPSLERITYDIRSFIAANEDPIILLDGLEYLMSNNKFNPVIRFLRHLVDECSETESIMLIPISPMAISEQELKMIERELEVVEH